VQHPSGSMSAVTKRRSQREEGERKRKSSRNNRPGLRPAQEAATVGPRTGPARDAPRKKNVRQETDLSKRYGLKNSRVEATRRARKEL